jgi:hypothetical protein
MLAFARVIMVTAIAVAAFAESTASKNLDIYWIDVEGLGHGVNSYGVAIAYSPSRVDDGNLLPQPAKGGRSVAPYQRNAYLRLARTPGVEDVWQSHLSLLDPDPHHNTAEQMIASSEETSECKGNRIKASIARDGRF